MLSGFTVGITADRRWEEQAALLDRRGATVLHGPTIKTLPHGADEQLRGATEQVIASPPPVLIANTGLGIRSWFSAAETWNLGEPLAAALASTRIYARGPKASGAVHSLGLDVFARAASERLSEAVDQALDGLERGATVAVQVDGSGGSPELARLEEAGMTVITIPVYEWRLPDDHRPALRLTDAVISGRVHAVTFTAGPAIRNWFAIAADHGLDGDLRGALNGGGVVVGCVGPVCAEAATACGLDEAQFAMPAAWRLGPLIRAVADRLVQRALTLTLGGHRLVVAGNAVTIDDEPILVTETEVQVLAMLASRPNVVVAKSELLQGVWRDEAADPHVVEVAVARLRRRLGAHGSAICSVHRRGYVLRT